MPEEKPTSVLEYLFPNKKLRTFFRIFKILLIALVIVLPIRWFVAQPFVVSGASMSPTFDSNEYIIIDKISYLLQRPQRGDVVIFKYPLDPSIYFIKRVIGLPGETIHINGNVVTIDGQNGVKHVLTEPYLSANDNKGDTMASTTLASDEYFVLGDNRDASSDSRTWGPLQERFIIGRAFLRLYPLNAIGFFPGSSASTTSL